MAGLTPEQFDKTKEIVLDDFAALPELLGGKSAKDQKLVADTIEQVKDIVVRHGRIAGYNNVVKAWSGQTPKTIASQLAANITVTTAELAKGYEHGDNPKSVLA